MSKISELIHAQKELAWLNNKDVSPPDWEYIADCRDESLRIKVSFGAAAIGTLALAGSFFVNSANDPVAYSAADAQKPTTISVEGDKDRYKINITVNEQPFPNAASYVPQQRAEPEGYKTSSNMLVFRLVAGMVAVGGTLSGLIALHDRNTRREEIDLYPLPKGQDNHQKTYSNAHRTVDDSQVEYGVNIPTGKSLKGSSSQGPLLR